MCCEQIVDTGCIYASGGMMLHHSIDVTLTIDTAEVWQDAAPQALNAQLLKQAVLSLYAAI